MSVQRPKVTIRFKYNLDTGEIEEFIVDDHAPAARESYHDQVAERVARRLVKNPEIVDAGPGATRTAASSAAGSEKSPAVKSSRRSEEIEE